MAATSSAATSSSPAAAAAAASTKRNTLCGIMAIYGCHGNSSSVFAIFSKTCAALNIMLLLNDLLQSMPLIIQEVVIYNDCDCYKQVYINNWVNYQNDYRAGHC